LGLALCVVIAVLATNTVLLWGKGGTARPSSVFAQAGRSATDATQGEQPTQDLDVASPLWVAQSEVYVFLDAWGGEIGIFSAPQGIAVGGEWVYVADTDNDRIQIFDVHGRPVAAFGGSGSAAGQFDSPRGIAVDGQGNVYVADTDNHRVQKFTVDGSYLTRWGSYGSGDGQFDAPFGIAVDGQGHV